MGTAPHSRCNWCLRNEILVSRKKISSLNGLLERHALGFGIRPEYLSVPVFLMRYVKMCGRNVAYFLGHLWTVGR
ncbi:hypothetical protein LshimejAT787_1301410 [Lyophyllum shimeji]|uniref:Uncharacterized protein n=1 Tax=Lyophyllum shimeji TaxID=47721 RepID=A0A9P3UT57_LYOSH|nr:hypothetical protein LshimejAT787_1301410 [Lyophyllum shimeji]